MIKKPSKKSLKKPSKKPSKKLQLFIQQNIIDELTDEITRLNKKIKDLDIQFEKKHSKIVELIREIDNTHEFLGKFTVRHREFYNVMDQMADAWDTVHGQWPWDEK